MKDGKIFGGTLVVMVFLVMHRTRQGRNYTCHVR